MEFLTATSTAGTSFCSHGYPGGSYYPLCFTNTANEAGEGQQGAPKPPDLRISGSSACIRRERPPEPAQWYLSFLEVLVWGQDILHSSKLSFWVSLPQPSMVALAGPTKAPSITQLAGDRTAHQGLKELQSLSHLDCGEQYDRI